MLGDVADVVAEVVQVLDVPTQHPPSSLLTHGLRRDGLEQQVNRGSGPVLVHDADEPHQPLHRGGLVPARRARHASP